MSSREYGKESTVLYCRPLSGSEATTDVGLRCVVSGPIYRAGFSSKIPGMVFGRSSGVKGALPDPLDKDGSSEHVEKAEKRR